MVLRFLLFVGVQLSVLAGILLFGPPSPADLFFRSTEIKETRFREAPSPRVVFLGGSNLAFGFDSSIVEQQTSLHPVNMGLFNPLGLPYQLQQVRTLFGESPARPGDRVVFSLEWQYFGSSLEAVPLALFDLVRNYPPAARHVALRDWRRMADALPIILGVRLRATLRQWRSPHQFSPEELLYLQGQFNEYGDVRREYRQGHFPLGPLVLDANRRTTLRTVRLLNKFADDMAEIGVATALVHPPTPDYSAETAGPEMAMIDGTLRSHARFAVLEDAAESRLPAELFLDTVFHLNADGAVVRAERTAALLKEWVAADQASPQPEQTP